MNRLRTIYQSLKIRSKLFSSSSRINGGAGVSHEIGKVASEQPAKKKSFWAMEEFANPESGYIYRENKNIQVSSNGRFLVHLVSGFIWYWIFMNFYYNLPDFAGHAVYPDMAAWTDEELGIPPESD